MVNRVIKFRFWNVQDNEYIANEDITISSNGELFWHDGKTINKNLIAEQFTGLTDKNGVDIYENDLVAIPYISPFGQLFEPEPDDENYLVEFKNGQFGFQHSTCFEGLEKYLTTSKGDYVSNAGNIIIYGDFIGYVVGNKHLLED